MKHTRRSFMKGLFAIVAAVVINPFKVFSKDEPELINESMPCTEHSIMGDKAFVGYCHIHDLNEDQSCNPHLIEADTLDEFVKKAREFYETKRISSIEFLDPNTYESITLAFKQDPVLRSWSFS